MKYYAQFQNNSGGYYHISDDVRENVIIEANNSETAQSIMDNLDNGANDWCNCCGERWSYCWEEYNTLEEAIESIYEWSPGYVVHLLDGTKKYNRPE